MSVCTSPSALLCTVCLAPALPFTGGGRNDPDLGEGLTRAEIPMPGENNKNESEKNSMRILLTGDSITDMFRDRNTDFGAMSYGVSYPYQIQAELGTDDPGKYEILNRGISGNRVVDLYARIKSDCWNLSPDVVSVLIGINDVWHEIMSRNGVELDRYEKVYRAFIEDTQKALPGVRFMLMEPLSCTVRPQTGIIGNFCMSKNMRGSSVVWPKNTAPCSCRCRRHLTARPNGTAPIGISMTACIRP